MRKFYPENPTDEQIKKYENLVKDFQKDLADFKLFYPDQSLPSSLYIAEQIHNHIEGNETTSTINEILMFLAIEINDFEKKWGVGNLSKGLKVADEFSKFLLYKHGE